ncbi:MAG TPA: chromosomal replication initiator protein DnaA [Halanaerobiaceae bacterium]|jgi:chromosomal replication initiator protein|nr:chromosomal replication initiator protein DnaA [Bacillota bacterium]HHU91874.1 chromosomal replication initiator protein DnaA [Halanaerobiaceae bacterium]HOA40775.1 chromosomal replication initiator protein DnaA [Halanaerobiales bacterium]HPZ62981.1 chromosomal replication initiator protein DnaA [Halanaerobiales bacterium]HQD04210.1 chromosomal replication initiator protein DnaA [Halanaerobiales bacterium]
MSLSKDELTHIWQETLNKIREKLAHPSFKTWFSDTKPFQVNEQNQFIIEVPNTFVKDWLETRYEVLIGEIIKELTNNDWKIVFLTVEEIENLNQKDRNDLNNAANGNLDNKANGNQKSYDGLNPKYVFDTFVVGNSNRFAHAAALAVAEAPAKAYNPLFIYGDVGLGKTHLMQAIAHFILEHNPDSKVVYVSSETFTNELINAIKDDTTVEFREKYRNIDVLLIDDIQFLAKKERTQEEFFHTFNALHESNRQLIISSDRPPKEIPTLEDRLRSRFEWGLITDIQKPDLETRIAILRKKADIENLEIPNEVIIYIANNIKSNIRELEGALTKVIAYASVVGSELNQETAQKALKDLLSQNGDNNRKVDVNLIQKIVSEYYNLDIDDMISKKRTQNIAFPRQIAMYLAREMTDLSLPQIGEEFGGRDHTTVIHAHNKIQELYDMDIDFKTTINKLMDRIKNN